MDGLHKSRKKLFLRPAQPTDKKQKIPTMKPKVHELLKKNCKSAGNKVLYAFLLLQAGFCWAQKDYTFVYQADSIIRTGVRLHDEAKYEEALRQYNKISHTDPNYLWAQYEKAMTLSAAEKKDELRTLLSGLYDKGLFKEYPGIYMLYGSFLSDAKEYDAAEKIFNEGLTYQPNNSAYLYNMAILYLRKEENQKALDLLKKVLTLNPNYTSAHYFIGLLAYDNGKIVEGTMAMMSYLAIAPSGRYAKEAILKLNANYAQNFLDKSKLVFNGSGGDNFEEMEVILRNGLPLKKAFKVKSEIDDVAIRQAQAVADYALEHKMGNGFFETTYMPWIADMMRKNLFEGYSYYMLLGLEEQLGKKLTTHKKKITAFYDNYISKDFWDVYGTRRMDHFGTTQNVLVSIMEGRPYLIGAGPSDKKEGKFKRLNDVGNVSAELTFKNDQAEGVQKYFDAKGNIWQEIPYVAGKREGTEKTYFENGSLRTTYEYKNGMQNGAGVSYYPNGGKQCVSNYKDDKRDGQQACYYPDGKKKSELNYTDGKANGTYTFYNETGDMTIKYTYKDDELNGDFLEYYDGRTLKTEAKYDMGNPVGSIRRYYPNKVMSEESVYVNGKITREMSYFPNGKLSTDITYDGNQQLESYVYYDWQGRKYYEEKYKSGELKSGMQYTEAKPAGTPLSLAKKPYVITDYEGRPIVKGSFDKGKKSGMWEYYYPSGAVKSKEIYANGTESGFRQDFNRNGTLKMACNQTEGKMNGQYESYNDGVLSQTQCYAEGSQNGPYQAFYSNGSISHEGFIEDGDVSYA